MIIDPIGRNNISRDDTIKFVCNPVSMKTEEGRFTTENNKKRLEKNKE